jgi:hypothetical protein
MVYFGAGKMKRLGFAVIGLVVCALNSGCASNTLVTFQSSPEGAAITDLQGKNIGTTPFQLNLVTEKLVKNESTGCFEGPGYNTIWSSGYRVTVSKMKFCDANLSEHYLFKQSRDTTGPGYEQDLQVAAQVASQVAAQLEQQRHVEQERVRNMAAASAILLGVASSGLAAFNETQSSGYSSYAPRQRSLSISCDSRNYGYRVATDCTEY